MRLFLLYAAQVAFIVAGFAAVSSVFVSINSDAMESTVTQLLSSTAVVATEQVVAPLDKFAVQALAWADILLANPALQCASPRSPEWDFEDPVAAASPSYVPLPKFVVSPGKEIKFAFLRNNLLAEYVYETFQMPDNITQLSECGAGRVGTDIDKGYSYFSPSMHHGGVTTSPDLVNCNMNLTNDGHGRLARQVVDSDWNCDQTTDFNAQYHDYELAARALTRNDSARGKWTIFSKNYDPILLTTTQLMTFGVPLNFSETDPVTGLYNCTNAATMDLNAQYLTDALHAESIAGVHLALFWDLEESLVAWTLDGPSSDANTGELLFAGATASQFDDALAAFVKAGWCAGNEWELSRCSPPTNGSSVSNAKYVFTLRRVEHVNARFTVVISGDRDTFFGPGERARAVGIGVSVAVCVVCLATSVILWLTTVRPLRRLIGNMELASTFSSDVDAEGDSCITEVNEANVAFLSMNEQLQMAKPFMPQHLIERLDATRRELEFDPDLENSTPISDNKSVSVHRRERDTQSVRSSRKSQALFASQQSSSSYRPMAAVTQVATLESRFVAILVVNVTSFDRSIRGLSSSEMQATYSRFIDVVLRVAKSFKGVLDSVQGDHVLISFNSSVRCAVPAAKAVSAAFSLRNGVKELPAAWQRFTCGIAVGHAYCGTLGNVEVKSHATLGHVVRQAIGLQRIARAFDDAFDGGASAAPGQRRHSPGWCFATARVVQDCSAFAHFRYEAIAQLPPSTRLTIIASVFPPFQPLDAAAPGAVTPGDGFGIPPSDAVVTHATNATDREWLYEVETTTNANPFKDANLLIATRFKSVVNISLDEANSLPPTMWSTQINDDVTRRSAPRLWGLE